MQSLLNCKKVIEISAAYLMKPSSIPANFTLSMDELLLNSSLVIDLLKNQQESLILFNPSSNHRNEIVSLKVNTPFFEIYDSDASRIDDYQLSLVWNDSEQHQLDFNEHAFDVVFSIRMSPLALKPITLKSCFKNLSLMHKFSKIKLIGQFAEETITNFKKK